MTTIVYRDGVMASDSLASYGDTAFTNVTKLFRLNKGGVIGISGNVDFRTLLELCCDIDNGDDLPSVEELSKINHRFTALLRLKDGLFCVETGDELKKCGVIPLPPKVFMATGSGEEFALGALDMGADAKTAARVACKFDLFSAPPIQTMKVRT